MNTQTITNIIITSDKIQDKFMEEAQKLKLDKYFKNDKKMYNNVNEILKLMR